MTAHRAWIMLFAAGVIAGGCAKAPARPQLPSRVVPAATPIQRLEFEGVSVLPPRGENWFIAPSLPSRPGLAYIVVFGKKLRERPPTEPVDAHTVVAIVMALTVDGTKFDTPEAFLQFLERDIEKQIATSASPRHRLLASKMSLDSSLAPYCVKYDHTVEDTGVPRFPGSVFIMTMQGFRCLHPHSPKSIIDIGYSQRFLKGQQPLRVEAEVEPFLKGVVFTPSPPPIR